MSAYDHIDFTPPEGAQKAAARALEVRASKPPSQRGMTGVGLARARDIANGKTLSPETVRRMLSFFQRHEGDKSGSTWGEQGKGWQAWNGWGGDPGFAWARKVVRQMEAADAKLASERCPTVLLSEDLLPEVGHRTWNQIAKLGEFRGHQQGAFAFTPDAFARIIENFAATENRRVPVDYEHTSEVLPENVAQEGVPAVAWIVDLDDRGPEGLWACFEWVDAKAVQYVRERRYLYVSPAVVFNAIDKASGQRIGARLTSVALTNHPFLDGLAPLVASETADATRLGLAPGDVHIPVGVTVTPRKEPEMDPEMMKSPPPDKLPMAEAPAAKPAEGDKIAQRYNAMRARLRAMGDAMSMPMAEGDEAAEDAMLDKLAAMVAEMKVAQQAEAEKIAEGVIASGRAASKDDLVALILSDRPRFDRLFPAQPEKPAPQPPTGDAKALLSGRVLTPAMHPTPAPQGDEKDESTEAYELAERMISEKKAPDFATAINLASREVRQRRAQNATSRLAPRG